MSITHTLFLRKNIPLDWKEKKEKGILVILSFRTLISNKQKEVVYPKVSMPIYKLTYSVEIIKQKGSLWRHL